MGKAKCFKGKSAVVTGAASGIGKELTMQLLDLGAIVTATDIDKDGLQRLANEFANSQRLTTETLDVTDRSRYESILNAVKGERGSLDYVFNNAGIAFFGEAKTMQPEQWERIIDINIRGVVNGTDIAYKIMCEQKSGHIVNTASGAGLMPIPLMSAYCMSKHAVVGLSTSLREEGKRYNVKVSAICPGVIATNIAHAMESNDFNVPDMQAKSGPKEIPVTQAVKKILSEVAKDNAKIVFPFAVKFGSKSYAVIPDFYSALTQLGLRKLLK